MAAGSAAGSATAARDAAARVAAARAAACYSTPGVVRGGGGRAVGRNWRAGRHRGGGGGGSRGRNRRRGGGFWSRRYRRARRDGRSRARRRNAAAHDVDRRAGADGSSRGRSDMRRALRMRRGAGRPVPRLPPRRHSALGCGYRLRSRGRDDGWRRHQLIRAGGEHRRAHRLVVACARQRAEKHGGGERDRWHGKRNRGHPFRRPTPGGRDPRAILGRPQPDIASGIDVAAGCEQRFEFDGRVGITAPACALQCRLGTGEIAAAGEDDSESERRSRMAGRVCGSIRPFGAGCVAARFEQTAEVERAIRIPALGCPLVGGLRLLLVPAFFDEDPEIDRRGRVAQRSRFTIRTFGVRQITAVLEPEPEAEPFIGSPSRVGYRVCAPSHPPKALPVVLPCDKRDLNDRRLGNFTPNGKGIGKSAASCVSKPENQPAYLRGRCCLERPVGRDPERLARRPAGPA